MRQEVTGGRDVPLTIKIAATLFVAFLVPVYWYHYGFLHFLWISDVALFLTLAALLRESRLLISMMALGVLPLELVWLTDFLFQLITGTELLGVTAYMFDPEQPLLLRALSLFHIPLVIIWVVLLPRWGYDPRALRIQTVLFVSVILATWLLTDPQDNVNWVHTPEQHDLAWMPGLAWVGLYLTVVPLLIYWPLHVFYRARFGPERAKR